MPRPKPPVSEIQLVANLRADLIAVYQPVNSQELFAIERIALTRQAILRAAQSRSSRGSKPCGPNYQTNPSWTPTRTKPNHLHSLKTNSYPPSTPVSAMQAAGRKACLRMRACTAPHAILKFPPHFSLDTHLESRFRQPGLSQKPR